jgi:hypothetical protein
VNLTTGLTSLIARGWYAWDVKSRADLPHNLPAGAWLKRLANTGTVIDVAQPIAIHPLEALAVEYGRFGDNGERTNWNQFETARLTFNNFCTYVSQALGLRRVGVAASWFWKFTPCGAMVTDRGQQVRRADHTAAALNLWAKLGIDGFGVALHDNMTATKPPAWRTDFWGKEVNW